MFRISLPRAIIAALAISGGAESGFVHARVSSPLGLGLKGSVSETMGAQAAPSFEIYVAPGGSATNPGTYESPVDSLVAACNLVDFRRAVSHTIYIRGGTYFDHSTIWIAQSGSTGRSDTCYNPYSLSSSHRLTIAAYGDERPVFEGRGQRVFLHVQSEAGACTNITIRGLTIRQYVVFAIGFTGDKDRAGDDTNRAGWNGCNTISDNTFEKIGNFHATDVCPATAPDEECMGVAAIDLVNSDRNIIRDNVFVRLENVWKDASHIHAVYMAHNSSGNLLFDNYVSLSTGEPFKVRDASNDNYVFANYTDRAGKRAFIQSNSPQADESISTGNVLADNVVTFPYPWFEQIQLIYDSDGSTFIDRGQKFFAGGGRYTEQAAAMAAGDFNGDGRTELVVAFNYRMLDSSETFVKIVRTAGGTDRHLSKVLYTSDYFTAHALAAGDFDRSGKDQLLTSLRLESSGRTEIWRGDGIDSVTSLGRIYQTTTWAVTALTAGDFDGNGRSESMVALQSSSGETRIYRGNGVSAALGYGAIYTSTSWRVPAMTAGDFDGDGYDELITALQRSTEARIVRGNGTTSIASYGTIYTSPTWEIPALAAGTFSADGPRLVTAFRHRGTDEVRLYQGNGLTSATGIRFYTSSSWRVSALVAKRLDGDAGAELATAFTWPSRAQIWASDGTSGATNRGIFHRWPAF